MSGRVAAVLVLCACGGTTGSMPEGMHSTAASEYEARELHGFTVRVERGLERTAEGGRAIDAVSRQLETVSRVLPERALGRVREVPLWLSVRDTACAASCYHPSAQWLTEHGYEPLKARAVEITFAAQWLEGTVEQPFGVLHELAHGYHDRVLGFGDAELEAALDRVKAEGALDRVDYVGGGQRRAYALTDARELFAELSEAWFGLNDYAPFDRRALEARLPWAAALVDARWSLP